MTAAISKSGATSQTETVVPTVVGDLAATIRIPTGARAPLPGVVVVEGSGDVDRGDWAGWPECLPSAGAAVLRYDKPGSGGSPGHWTEQTVDDRARESLAALRILRAHPATAGQPVGLYGMSQGGWVVLAAAAIEPESVDFIVCHCGPGMSPAQQERYRLESWVRGTGHDEGTITEAMAWVDRRADLIRRGRPAEAVLAEQSQHASRPWYATVTLAYDTPESLRFVRRILDFDPTRAMPQVRCPVLALFGGADTLVPAQASLRAFAEHLPLNSQHGFAVFPGADHGLYATDPDPAVPRRDQLASAYLPTVTAFLANRRTG